MNGNIYTILLIAVVAAVTALIRFFPFLIFPEGKKAPKLITYLSGVLPAAVMGMLVIYCLRNTTFLVWPHAIPELIAVVVVLLLHIWKRNTLLSIFAGTICYMLLIQFVF